MTTAHSTFIAPTADELNGLVEGYEIDSLIAAGGMGAVYYARQASLDRPVAIKFLPRELGENPSYRAQFEAEAKAMARLNHPNLVGVYDFGDVDGLLYIVMELVDGNSLFDAAHGQASDPAESMRVAIAICHGLQHAHENGILHRDIKPSNILLSVNGTPKIADFGLAQPVNSEDSDEEGDVFGTPHYTAPEVLHSPNQIDARSDIFSVGVILHELLTGMVPAADRRPPSAISGCDRRLDAIVRKATHPNPAQRYSSAAEMAAAMEQVLTKPAGPILQASARPSRALTPHRPVAYSSSSSGTGWVIFLMVLVAAALLIMIFTRGS